MSDCASIQESISALVDGELSGEDLETVLRHLDQCGDCAAVRAEMVRLKAVAQVALASTSCPSSLRRRVSHALNAEVRERREEARAWRPVHFVWAPAALAAGLLLLFAGRPGYVPLHELPSLQQRNSLHRVAHETPQTAALALREELDIGVRPVELAPLGLRFESAGRTSLGGCKGAYFTFVTPGGQRLTVFEICPQGKSVPAGRSASRYNLPDGWQILRTADGRDILFLKPPRGLVVAICSDLPLQKAADAGKLVGEQLARD
jgi:hypothetical protein